MLSRSPNMRRVLSVLLVGLLVLLSQQSLAAQRSAGRPSGRQSQTVQRPSVPQQIADLQAQIDNLEAQVADIVMKVDANTASVVELGAAVLALEARVSRAETSIADLQAYQTLQDALIEQLTTRWEA